MTKKVEDLPIKDFVTKLRDSQLEHYTPPINFLRYLTRGRCPWCEQSKTSTYEDGKVRRHHWECLLHPGHNGERYSGHRYCTDREWMVCPLRK